MCKNWCGYRFVDWVVVCLFTMENLNLNFCDKIKVVMELWLYCCGFIVIVILNQVQSSVAVGTPDYISPEILRVSPTVSLCIHQLLCTHPLNTSWCGYVTVTPYLLYPGDGGRTWTVRTGVWLVVPGCLYVRNAVRIYTLLCRVPRGNLWQNHEPSGMLKQIY